MQIYIYIRIYRTLCIYNFISYENICNMVVQVYPQRIIDSIVELFKVNVE